MPRIRVTIRTTEQTAERMEALAFVADLTVNEAWNMAAERLLETDYVIKVEQALKLRE